VAWTKQRYVVGGVIAVGVLLLISEHGNQPISGWDTGTSGNSSTSVPSVPGGARPCTVTVTADQLNARSSPDGNAPVVDTYRRGEVVSADRTTTNGFRQLVPGRWVAQEFVEPTAGSDCG
jgi:hypothetical protein